MLLFFRKSALSLSIWVALVAMIATWVAPTPAMALGRDTRVMLVSGAYGALAGTAAGFVMYPITHETKTIFVGTSVGLYLGIVVGIYYITHRDDPGNPLRNTGLLEESSRPDLALAAHEGVFGSSILQTPRPELELNWPVYRF